MGLNHFEKIVNTDGSRKAMALLKVTFRVVKLSIFQCKFLPLLSMPFLLERLALSPRNILLSMKPEPFAGCVNGRMKN